VLLVVAFHAGLPVPGGFMGVDVFFAISGFVITSMLFAELESSGRIDFPRFYVRRARRLLPALALMLSVVLLLGAVLSPAVTQHMTALTGMAASVFAANVYLLNLGTGYFDMSTALNPLLHTWTLAVEEQFYLVFPALLLLGWLLGRRRPRFSNARAAAAVVLGVATVGSLALYLELSAGWSTGAAGSPERLAFYGSPTRAWEFGAGALLALAAPWAARMSGLVVRVVGATGLLAIALAAFSARDVWAVPGTAALLPVFGTCALIAAGTARPRAAWRALTVRPVVWIGDLSYSLYLWHWPLIVFAKSLWPGFALAAPAAAAFSLVPAWLSFRFVENPIRRGVRLPGKAFAAFALTCILVPVAAGFGLLDAKNALAAKSSMGSWTRSRALHADVLKGCDNPYPLSERKGGLCVWTLPAARGSIVLVGDSNAGHFTEAVVQAARRARFNLTVVTFSSCPFVDVGAVRAEALKGERLCRRFNGETLAAITRLKPNLVITAARSDQYIEDDSIHLRNSLGRLTARPEEKARLWERGLESTVAQLGAADVPVLVVHPVPMFPAAPDECSTLAILTSGCASSVRRATVDSRLRRARWAEEMAVATVSNAIALDFEDAVCTSAQCSTSREGTILYRDSEHLSVDGALTLTDDFYRAIVKHARGTDDRGS
jgi:peptidoglycan/LPS O-acetylase OafA/YrhL